MADDFDDLDNEPKAPSAWARFGAKMRERAAELKRANDENAALKKQVGELTTENTQLKGQVSNPTGDRKRVLELEGEIRTGKHKARFAERAKAAGMNESAIDDVFSLSGYKAESDDIDDSAIDAVIADAKAKRSYAFAKGDQGQGDGQGQGQGQQQQQQKQVPGAGRSSGHTATGDGTIITAEQRSDPAFMLSPSGWNAAVNAAKEHRFRG